MKYIEISIKIKKEAEEALFNLLNELGTKGVSVVGEDILKGEYETIKSYFDEKVDADKLLEKIREGLQSISNYLDIGKIEINLNYTDEEDWANSWKKYYKPVEIGNIVITPTWENYEKEGKIVVEIDPGMAFGTGTHETTLMCIKALQDYLKPGMSVIDIGTGTGILAIVSKKLGADRVLAIDIDDIAVDIAKKNSALNKTPIEVIKGNLIEGIEERFDLVIANLTAELITKLIEKLHKILKENSICIFSGIIESRLKEVVDKLKENNINVIEIKEKNNWFLVVAKY
ncbi:MAG: 50S ribosomal protein L11 methyltransferase [Dictyoglomus sp. NZ13-RE01]|nr:MAG: 50S ribosomal protein L11 methyltransferase [Dictyoglomus sp. NZ13-RE01]